MASGISNEIIDLSQAESGGGGGGVRVPEGDYEVKVTGVKYDTSSSGNPMLIWEVTGTKGKLKGKKLREYTVLKANSYWKLRDLCEAVTGKIPKAMSTRDLLKWCKANVVGQTAGVTLGDEDYVNDKGKTVTTSKISDWVTLADLSDEAPEEAEEVEEEDADIEEEDDEESEDDADDDLDGLSRNELKALIKAEELEVTVKKSMDDDALREAIRAARPEDDESEEDEEEDDEEESDEDDGLDEMDRAELKAHIKANKLDIKVLKSMSDDDIRSAIRGSSDDEEEIEEVDLDEL